MEAERWRGVMILARVFLIPASPRGQTPYALIIQFLLYFANIYGNTPSPIQVIQQTHPAARVF